MREIKNGDTLIGLKASPLSLFFYKREFGTDLLNDLIKMQKKSGVELDTMTIMQIGYALNVAYNYPDKTPSFLTWFEGLEVLEVDLLTAIMEEASNLFVTGKATKGATVKKK